MTGALTATNVVSPETRYNLQLLIECSFLETVDETTLLNELSADLIAGPVGPLVCFSARITVHGCTVRANVIRAVLISYLQLRHDDRK